MPTRKLTDELVARTAPPRTGRLELWDEALPGFGLRISAAGRRVWQLMYRIDGRKRRLSLGTFPALPLEIARDAARAALKEVAKGNDPGAERASVRGAEFTFERFARAYIERYAKRTKKTWKADARMIERDLVPTWGRRGADTIGRRDVIEMIEGVCARGHPYAANRRLALLRRMYAWGLEVDLVRATPVIGIAAPGHEVRRRRLLGDDEIVGLWRAWDNMAWPFGPLFKLMLLTAQRRRQVASLRLADIALANQVWRVPHGADPSSRRHDIPLSSLALEIIASVPRSSSAYMFPARGRPGRHVSGFSKAARRAGALSGVADWRTEDLRRTAAASMIRLGAAPAVVRQILDHAKALPVGGIEVEERRHAVDDTRAAIEAWGEHVRALMASENSAAGPEGT